jgi:hypothetical protein
MLARSLLLLALVVGGLGSSGCSRPDGAPTAVAPSDPSKAVSPPPNATPTPSSTAVAPQGFPALEDACTIDADCDIAFVDRACCPTCGGLYGNKKWVADVTAYCALPGSRGTCTPEACGREIASPRLGYIVAPSKCKAGHCTDK